MLLQSEASTQTLMVLGGPHHQLVEFHLHKLEEAPRFQMEAQKPKKTENLRNTQKEGDELMVRG